jgi:hypothetical protein
MLPAAMRRVRTVSFYLLALVAAIALASCGGEQPGGSEGVEGEPVVVDDVSYNVGITRPLNPDDPEDREYLVGQPLPEEGTYYLGVFINILNETDEPHSTAHEYTVLDTLDNEYHPVESESPYALEIGAEVPADGEIPEPDTTAQTGPNQGALLIFHVEDSVSANRPLRLEIGGSSETGEVILDI